MIILFLEKEMCPRKKEGRKTMPEIVATMLCLQHPRALHALGSEQFSLNGSHT
jgi:hypothetical protein